jgi:HTH-type transcriptional regulator, competence development regulator
LRKAAMQADIDVAILSKMERGERKLTKELILKLAKMYNENPEKLIVDFLSEKVIYDLNDEEFGLEALKVAEKELKYRKGNDK